MCWLRPLGEVDIASSTITYHQQTRKVYSRGQNVLIDPSIMLWWKSWLHKTSKRGPASTGDDLDESVELKDATTTDSDIDPDQADELRRASRLLDQQRQTIRKPLPISPVKVPLLPPRQEEPVQVPIQHLVLLTLLGADTVSTKALLSFDSSTRGGMKVTLSYPLKRSADSCGFA